MRRDILISTLHASSWDTNATNKVVRANNGHLYRFFTDQLFQNISWSKSTDGGLTWSKPVILDGGCTAISVWYDRWSDVAGDKIHIAWTVNDLDDTLYQNMNTASADALSAVTTIFAGASTSVNGTLSIARARGGNLFCYTKIDVDTEGVFARSTDVGAVWATRTLPEAIATADLMILAPGFAADNQDIIGIFWDASANEVSRYVHDDSANTWAETSIALLMVENAGINSNFSVEVDLANSRLLLVAWSGTDVLLANLLCWTVTEGAITAKANVVTGSIDDQALCAICMDPISGYWYVAYAGKTDGSETWLTGVNIYYRVSRDAGTTWSAELKLNTAAIAPDNMQLLLPCPRKAGEPMFSYGFNAASGPDNGYLSIDDFQRQAALMIMGG